MQRYYTKEDEIKALEEAIDKSINTRIDNLNKKIDKINERKQEKPRNLFGKLDKMFDKIYLRIYQKTAARLGYLSRSFFDLQTIYAKSSYSQITSNLKDSIEIVSSQLAKEDQVEFMKVFNASMQEQNKKAKSEIAEAKKKVKLSLKKTKMAAAKVFFGKNIVTFSGAADTIAGHINGSLSKKGSDVDITFSRQDTSPVDMYAEDALLNDLERFANASEELRKNREVQNVLGSAKVLRETIITRKKAEKLNSSIEALLNSLTITSLELESVVKFLAHVQENNNKTIQKCDAYIQKFNFDYLKKIVEEERRKEAEQQRREQFLQNVAALVYDIEKAKAEGRSIEEIAKLEKELRDLSASAPSMGLAPGEFESALHKGRMRFSDDKFAKEQAKRLASEQATIAFEQSEKLRELAIQQLQAEGAFDNHEWRNGDVYSSIDPEQQEKMIRQRMNELSSSIGKISIDEKAQSDIQYHDKEIQSAQQDLYSKAVSSLEAEQSFIFSHSEDKEAIIRQRMKEMIDYASMTPEQRGLKDWKNQGVVSQDATLSDLSQQQLMDLRTAYRDTEEDKQVKEVQGVVNYQQKQKANTIYAQYLRYRASLADKKSALKFSEFASLIYSQEGIELSQVDEEVKGRSI